VPRLSRGQPGRLRAGPPSLAGAPRRAAVVAIAYAAWDAAQDKSDPWGEMFQCIESAGHQVRAQRSEVWS
jgi:hypothetical protein